MISPYINPTTLLYSHAPVPQVLAEFERHDLPRPATALIGKDPTGTFRTACAKFRIQKVVNDILCVPCKFCLGCAYYCRGQSFWNFVPAAHSFPCAHGQTGLPCDFPTIARAPQRALCGRPTCRFSDRGSGARGPPPRADCRL
jgi:hypothetical protein